MASSKPGSRRAAPRKATTRKPKSSPAASTAAGETKKGTASRAAVKNVSVPKTEKPVQAAQGQNMSVSSVKNVTPPVALAAGQNPSPMVVATTEVENQTLALTKKELVDEAVLRSGIKKKDAKPVVEALLAVLGEAVAEGRDLNLRPFGKLRINRSETRSNGTIHICRLRQPLEASQNGEEAEEKSEAEGSLSLHSPLAEAVG